MMLTKTRGSIDQNVSSYPIDVEKIKKYMDLVENITLQMMSFQSFHHRFPNSDSIWKEIESSSLSLSEKISQFRKQIRLKYPDILFIFYAEYIQEHSQQEWQNIQTLIQDLGQLRQEIAESAYALIRSLANQMSVAEYLKPDLEQEGYMALLNALDQISFIQDFSIIRYFQSYIRYQMLSFLKKNQMIAKQEQITDFHLLQSNLEMNHLLEDLMTNLSKNQDLQRDLFIEKQLLELLETALESLSEKELLVIQSNFGWGSKSPMSLADIARNLSISRERARQLRNQALRKIRLKLRKQNVEDIS